MSNDRVLYRRFRRGAFVLALCLLLQMLVPLSALAQSTAGSLRLDCHVVSNNRSIPLAGDTYAIVKVADITVGSGDPAQLQYATVPAFEEAGYGDDDWATLEDEERQEAAGKLAAIAQGDPNLIQYTETTDALGSLLFSPLETGLYLVLRTQSAPANQACTIDPFLVDVPTLINGKLVYDLKAVPKVSCPYISIRPSNVTIYMGGDYGYDAVGGEDTTDLPKPMFVIDAPAGVDVEDLVLVYYDDPSVTQAPAKRYEWHPVAIGTDEEGNACYRLDRADGTSENFHVEYVTSDGSAIRDDNFEPWMEQELYKVYDIQIPLSDDELLLAYMRDAGGAVFYPVERGRAELTVRGVENDSIIGNDNNPVTRVFDEDETIPKIPSGAGIVVAPQGTTYTLNDTDIEISDIHGPDVTQERVGLLFDGIINDVYDRETELEKQTDRRMPALAPGAVRYYQSQYLDLVDTNAGNAWVTASNPISVYWGYPEGTDENTEFTLWHFRGLHRDGTDDSLLGSGYDLSDIQAVEPEKVTIERMPEGIRFTVEPGGFSPFVLVWEEKDTMPGEPTPPPETEPTPSPEDGNLLRPFVPQTGDNSQIAVWVGLLIISSVAIIGLTMYQRRKVHKK